LVFRKLYRPHAAGVGGITFDNRRYRQLIGKS